MAAVKLTKNELKKQKDSLKRFQRYLPTLQLKKQQLQMMIRQVEAKQAETQSLRDDAYEKLREWIAVFGEDVGIEAFVSVRRVEIESGNIAGIDIPVFAGIEFDIAEYDLFSTPLWVDAGIEKIKELAAIDAELEVLERQRELLADELRITTQRVNLFEKVKIPETQENIRVIRIYLGDQQTAAVVRGKMAKNKVVRAS
ncbi:MAG: V-type ATP synthase subunit D [Spirochaetaceae bacterium]|nr:MAG: V-type ATP synthase subunit D [Spirochaetaceae bacterium]